MIQYVKRIEWEALAHTSHMIGTRKHYRYMSRITGKVVSMTPREAGAANKVKKPVSI
jgi:hypothetical protein